MYVPYFWFDFSENKHGWMDGWSCQQTWCTRASFGGGARAPMPHSWWRQCFKITSSTLRSSRRHLVLVDRLLVLVLALVFANQVLVANKTFYTCFFDYLTYFRIDVAKINNSICDLTYLRFWSDCNFYVNISFAFNIFVVVTLFVYRDSCAHFRLNLRVH